MKKGLNANQLKLIAIISMTIDHIVSVVYPNYPTAWWIILLHIIGRITAPTMWFLIVEGYHHTHNLKKYITRMFIFAFISHFAYNFAFGIPFIPFKTSVFNQTSVIWPLAFGLVALSIVDSEKFKQWQKTALIFVICALTFCSDWSCIAVRAIVGIGSHRGNFKRQMSEMIIYVSFYAIVYFMFINKIYGLIQFFVVLSIPFLMQYNGERGSFLGHSAKARNIEKWFFYIYYPAHLILCGIIRILMHGNIGVMIGG